MRHFLQLGALEPLAKGNLRLVYAHPDGPGLVVKVMRPEAVELRYDGGAPWFKRWRRYRHYVLFIREIHEYVAAYARHGKSLPFVQRIVGFVETDLGLGLVTDAIRDSRGNLAPTLATLIETGGYDRVAEAALESFIRQLLESDLVVADLHERNLVYSALPGGEPHFVMIDGIGDSNILPLKSLSRTLNNRSRRKRVTRLRQRIALRQSNFR